ncbi:uncharacterized protein LOC115679679 isoform X1 [Syzygium oleosum]|uniref:uncharacterized protein LOC115679679 isoform X1 n=1 Tax=Syzygium oleosum TaxID=219896 RepID=UPI0011D2B131|nr:uncharacterized protein LOC115679679 isoform X1 [Syzygium oleosum]XP_030459208.1 uncharacterized protein LOC115679679 isoform X1 [Syzygium oleosum]
MGTRSRRQAVLPILLLIVIFGVGWKVIAENTLSSHGRAPGRRLLQVDNASDTSKYSGDNTDRVDPLDNFKKYRGGYNLTNKHYWSSTIFTGVYGYTIAMLWLLIGVAFGFYTLLVRLRGSAENCRELQKRSQCHKLCPLWPVLIAFVYMVLAIVAVGLVLGANAKFHSRAKTVVSIIIDTADDASEKIHNTTGAMRDIKDTLEVSNGSAYTSSFLTTTSEKLDSEAADIRRQARKNRRLIDKGLEIVYIVTTVTICLNLVAVIALSVSGFLRLRRLLYWLIALCWLLTVLCWIFFGLYFFLNKFSSDTCTVLDDFQQDPNNNSLSSILPCDELLSAKSILSDVSAGIYDMVNKVNANISYLQATSFPNIMYVCNPFSPPPEYEYQPDKCPGNSIRIGDIPKVLKIFTCSDPNDGNCAGSQYLSASKYKMVEAYTSSIQSLLDAYPGMESLIECQSVKDAFSQILTKHCGPLNRYARMVWASLAFLSVIMMFLVLIWTAKAIQDEEHRHPNGSVKPHSTAPDPQEPVKTKEFQDNVEYGSV